MCAVTTFASPPGHVEGLPDHLSGAPHGTARITPRLTPPPTLAGPDQLDPLSPDVAFAPTALAEVVGSALTVADNVFRTLVDGPRPLAVDGRRLGWGLPRRMIALDELKVILLHPATDADARNGVWRHLVRQARTGGPAWVVGAVGVAMPALRRMAARLAVDYQGDTADLDAELLAGFLAALRTIDLDAPKVITRLCSPAFHAARRLRNADVAARSGTVTTFAAAPPPAPYGHPDLVLARAVAAGVITATEARVIGTTRLEEVSLDEYAAATGATYAAVAKCRKRGEAKLVAALSRGWLDHDGATIAEATLTTAFDPYDRVE